jgi:L-alanine-DL-glutamate epimerase-like enolase superfamily enzyme
VTGDGLRIARLQSANIKHILSTPIHYGDWVMRHREFVLVSVQLESGVRGFSYGLTREGPVSAIIGRSIAPKYVGCDVQDPASLYYRALWSNHAVHAAGIGMRALSLVDLAVWDALAKSRGVSLHEHLSPGRPLLRLPATAIVGYPPSMSPDETQEMIRQLQAAGLDPVQDPDRTGHRPERAPAPGGSGGRAGRLDRVRREHGLPVRRRDTRLRTAGP